MYFSEHLWSISPFRTVFVALLFLLANLAYTQSAESVTAISWSPDGGKLVSASSTGKVTIWDAVTGAAILEIQGHLGKVTDISWRPDNTQIATASPDDKSVRIWDAQTGILVAELRGDRYYEGWAYVRWNPNSNLIVTLAPVTDGGSFLHVWKVEGNDFVPLAATYNVSALDISWSPDGRTLAVADIRGIYLFDEFTAASLTPRIIPSLRVTIAWSPDGTKLAGTEARTGKIEVFEVAAGEVVTAIQLRPPAQTADFAAISWTKDGLQLLIYDFDGSLQVWSAETGEFIETLNTGLIPERNLLALSPHGARTALGGDIMSGRGVGIGELAHVVRTLAGGMIQILVPDASFDRLNSIAQACISAEGQRGLTLASDTTQLPAFVEHLANLTDVEIPPGCRADLLAIVSVLRGE